MKVIIDNKTGLELADCLTLIQEVAKVGKISNNGKQHCYLARIPTLKAVYMVESRLNKQSERFIIYKEQ